MAKQQTQKVNSPRKKLAGDIIPIAVVLLAIAVYVFAECYSVTHVEVETVTAVTSTVYESVDATALAVREEYTVDSGNSGVTVACVDDGEKVKQGGNIAMVFDSKSSAQNYSTALSLQSDLDYYIELESKSAGVATDVESLDDDIIDNVNEYIRNADSYTDSSLDDSALELNDKLTSRQLIIGEDVDFTTVKESLQSQLNEIDISSCSPTDYVTTENSGIFSSYTDDFESVVDYDSITELDVDTLDELIEQAQQAEKGEHLGKMVTAYQWYFCCKVSVSDIGDISDGDTLNIALKDSDDVIECEVVSGADTDLGTEETVLILSSSEMDADIASMRVEEIEIRYNEYTGFKVPASAVHVDDDGNKIVYALTANQVNARYGEVLYSTKDYTVFAYDAQNEDGIRLYDQIITQGKDLYDGKVYT